LTSKRQTTDREAWTVGCKSNLQINARHLHRVWLLTPSAKHQASYLAFHQIESVFPEHSSNFSLDAKQHSSNLQSKKHATHSRTTKNYIKHSRMCCWHKSHAASQNKLKLTRF
jgi:hypothetical protein